MKKYIKDRSLLKQKKRYFFLIGISVISILAGIFFFFILADKDKMMIKGMLDEFFFLMKKDNLNYQEALINGIKNLFSSSILIWILGISIIGLPIILLFYFLKCFIFGFSISSIIATYGPKGIFRAVIYIFPHQIINLIVSLLLTFYAVSFSIKLIQHLFFHQNINLKSAMKRYFRILLFSLLILFLSLLYEVFLSTYFFQLLLR